MKRFFLFLFFVCVAGPVWAGNPVTLRESALLEAPVVRLADVFEGLSPEKDTEIAISPSPGKSVTYDERVLSSLAGRYGLEWVPAPGAKITLTRAASIISPDMIRQAIVKKIGEPDNGEIEIRFDNRILGLTLPASEPATFTLSAFEYDPTTQRFRGDVVAQNSGEPVIQTVMGRVIMKRSIPVLAKALSAGTILSNDDLAWITQDDTRLGDDVVTQAEQIVGFELTRNKGEGERLRIRDLGAPRLIKRGELVTLKTETSRILITAQGKAIQDGALGETVRVTNTQSNRVVEGTVIGPGLVRVGASHKVAAAE